MNLKYIALPVLVFGLILAAFFVFRDTNQADGYDKTISSQDGDSAATPGEAVSPVVEAPPGQSIVSLTPSLRRHLVGIFSPNNSRLSPVGFPLSDISHGNDIYLVKNFSFFDYHLNAKSLLVHSVYKNNLILWVKSDQSSTMSFVSKGSVSMSEIVSLSKSDKLNYIIPNPLVSAAGLSFLQNAMLMPKEDQADLMRGLIGISGSDERVINYLAKHTGVNSFIMDEDSYRLLESEGAFPAGFTPMAINGDTFVSPDVAIYVRKGVDLEASQMADRVKDAFVSGGLELKAYYPTSPVSPSFKGFVYQSLEDLRFADKVVAIIDSSLSAQEVSVIDDVIANRLSKMTSYYPALRKIDSDLFEVQMCGNTPYSEGIRANVHIVASAGGNIIQCIENSLSYSEHGIGAVIVFTKSQFPIDQYAESLENIRLKIDKNGVGSAPPIFTASFHVDQKDYYYSLAGLSGGSVYVIDEKLDMAKLELFVANISSIK